MEIEGLKDAGGQLSSENIIKASDYGSQFLFLDKIIKLEKNRIVAIKDVRHDEDFFKDHFAGFPIMPGALIMEGIGQAAALLVRYSIQNHSEKYVLAHKVKEARFMAPVFPGTQIKYEVELLAFDSRWAVLRGKAHCSGSAVAEALFMLAVVDKKDFREKHGFQS